MPLDAMTVPSRTKPEDFSGLKHGDTFYGHP